LLVVFRVISLSCLTLLLAVGVAGPADAQEPEPTTRAEVLRLEREKKQQSLQPNEPDGLQRAMDYVEDRAFHLLARDGWYPKIGSLTTGSGFAFGAGYRDRDAFAHRGVVELWGAASFKKYWATQARVAFPELVGGLVTTDLVVNLRDYPSESFYGIGPDSDKEGEREFGLRLREFGGSAGLRVVPHVVVGVGAALFGPRAEDRQVNYLRSNAFLEVDYREPSYARRGGWYRLDFSQFHDQDGGTFSFDRFDLDARQFIGFLADRRVIALRAYVSTSNASEGSVGMPFYLMPTLGGNDSLRGFANYRFRAPHAMLVQAEYRFEVWSGLDAALFYDAGKVALQRSDLSFKNLEDDYGFGFRFNTSQGVVMRVDAAFGGREGNRVHIVFGGVF
jgi:hypothetical protein